MSVAVTPSRPALTVVAVTRPRTARAALLNLAVEAGCEILAHVAQAGSALVTSRESDRMADQHVGAVRRLASRGMEDSAALHGCPCWRRFQAIDQHAAHAQTHDSAEDTLIVKAAGILGSIREIARALNRSLESEITKRGWRR